MKRNLKKIALVSMITILSSSMFASEMKKGVEVLSPEVRVLLLKEMQGVEKGMKDIFSNIIAGNWPEVKKIANQIKNSYILEQNLTKEQEQELAAKLPKGFLELDGKFHNQAKMLAHAADMENAELANFYTYKMQESCVSCHSTYAQSKFPSFAKTLEKDSSGHH
jgi:cytochrome c556